MQSLTINVSQLTWETSFSVIQNFDVCFLTIFLFNKQLNIWNLQINLICILRYNSEYCFNCKINLVKQKLRRRSFACSYLSRSAAEQYLAPMLVSRLLDWKLNQNISNHHSKCLRLNRILPKSCVGTTWQEHKWVTEADEVQF